MTTQSFAIPKIRSCSLLRYISAIFLSVLSAILVLQLWKVEWLYIPFVYSGDQNYFRGDWVYYAMTIKSTITTGWYLTNPMIGIPDGHFLGDFPTPEGLNYLIIKILSLFSSDWVLIFNLFFLLGFPLITLSSLFVLLRLGLSYPFALTASLLYTFLPFHLMRGEGHAFLSSYYILPLAIWLAILLYQNRLFENINSTKRRMLLYMIICILIGSNGVYHAYFSAFFMAVAALISVCTTKQWRTLKYAGFFIGVIFTTMIINIWPTVIYQIKNGANPEAFHRFAIESEIYGLKISQLLLPVDNDRIFGRLKHKYNTQNIPEYPFQSVNENTTAALGIIGSLGFLILVGRIFLKRKDSENSLMDALAHFNLSAVLLATMGGVSSLIAFFLMRNIRCYNRISVFIGFFVLAAFFLFLQKKVKNQRPMWTCSLFLLVFGLFNQSTKADALPYKIKKMGKTYAKDQAFFQKIEQTLPPGSMVFQLPYLNFPEGIAHRMFSYEHFKGPLHTNQLKWSFGAIHGRKADLWQRHASALPVPDMLKEIIQKGFTGLYIDRDGYVDRGQAMESSLFQMLQIEPLVDRNRSFWDLREYAKSLDGHF